MSHLHSIWSNDPYAPQISSYLYLFEKGVFGGGVIKPILYGIVIAIFFQAMGALLNPANRIRGGIQWVFVIHTAATFLCVTINVVTGASFLSMSYVDNREYPGDAEHVPGPFGYQEATISAIGIVCTFALYVGQWLADGLLLYRCYVIYAMKFWVIAIPCLMYLATIAISVVHCYYYFEPIPLNTLFRINALFGLPYWSIILSLNISLMLMIIGRLLLHIKNFHNAVGAHGGTMGLCKTVAVVLVESYALYCFNLLGFIVTLRMASPFQPAFATYLASTQAIAPLLIIIRVANRTALTSDAITKGDIDSIRFKSQGESTDTSGSLPDTNPTSSVDVRGESRIAVENIAEAL